MTKVLNFILPTPCVLCQKLGAPICMNCKTSFQTVRQSISLADVLGFSYSDYTQQAAVLINSVKEKGITSLIPLMAEMLIEDWPEHLIEPVFVPLPSSTSNTKKRGFSHTTLMAKALAKRVPKGSSRELLRSSRARADQVGLSQAERTSNMTGAFRSDLRGFQDKGRPLVLVDDVLTSGASMSEAIECLGASGLKVASFLVFSRAGAR